VTIDVDLERVRQLETELERAHARNDQAEIERLQGEYRRVGEVARISRRPIELRGGSGAEPARSRGGPSPVAASAQRIQFIRLLRRAFEDIEYLRLDEHPTTEISAGLFGHIKGDAIVIHEVRANLFVEGYSPDQCIIDVDAWKLFDRAEARLVGDAHSHVFDDPQASAGDLRGWRHAARSLGTPYAALILTRGEVWEEGMPRMSWEQPTITGWVVDPDGLARPAVVTIEPAWLADLRAQVRRRDPEVDDA
jgi:hypothetical protein